MNLVFLDFGGDGFDDCDWCWYNEWGLVRGCDWGGVKMGDVVFLECSGNFIFVFW